jgi:hypothetical protein
MKDKLQEGIEEHMELTKLQEARKKHRELKKAKLSLVLGGSKTVPTSPRDQDKEGESSFPGKQSNTSMLIDLSSPSLIMSPVKKEERSKSTCPDFPDLSG